MADDYGLSDLEPDVTETPDDEIPMAEEGEPEPMQGTVTIPKSALAGRDVSEGDTVTLRVVSVDDDGVRAELATNTETGEPGYEEPNAAIDSMAGGY